MDPRALGGHRRRPARGRAAPPEPGRRADHRPRLQRQGDAPQGRRPRGIRPHLPARGGAARRVGRRRPRRSRRPLRARSGLGYGRVEPGGLAEDPRRIPTDGGGRPHRPRPRPEPPRHLGPARRRGAIANRRVAGRRPRQAVLVQQLATLPGDRQRVPEIGRLPAPPGRDRRQPRRRGLVVPPGRLVHRRPRRELRLLRRLGHPLLHALVVPARRRHEPAGARRRLPSPRRALSRANPSAVRRRRRAPLPRPLTDVSPGRRRSAVGGRRLRRHAIVPGRNAAHRERRAPPLRRAGRHRARTPHARLVSRVPRHAPVLLGPRLTVLGEQRVPRPGVAGGARRVDRPRGADGRRARRLLRGDARAGLSRARHARGRHRENRQPPQRSLPAATAAAAQARQRPREADPGDQGRGPPPPPAPTTPTTESSRTPPTPRPISGRAPTCATSTRRSRSCADRRPPPAA